MDDSAIIGEMQKKLMSHFNNDVNRAKSFIKDCKTLGLDLGDVEVIKAVASKTPVFMNLLTHDEWGVLSTFARVIRELKGTDNDKDTSKD